MKIEIHPRDITPHDPGPFCGTPADPILLADHLSAPLPRIGERIRLRGRSYTVDEIVHDYGRGVIELHCRRWPAKEVAP